MGDERREWWEGRKVGGRETFPPQRFGVGLAPPGRPQWPHPELTDAGRGPGILSNTPVWFSPWRWVPRYQDPVPFSDYTCLSISGQICLPMYSSCERWYLFWKLCLQALLSMLWLNIGAVHLHCGLINNSKQIELPSDTLLLKGDEGLLWK